MEIPKLRLVLLAFLLLSVFSCFVITACTSEQPKRPVSSVTPTATATAKVTPTPEPTATPSPTETPSPTYTSTPSNPNRDSTECESIVPSLCARSRTDQPAPDQNLTDVIVGRWQSRYNTNSPGSGNYQIITTVEFYSDGTYKFGAYDTSKDPLRVQSSGQWKRTDKNIIFANTKDSDSGKVYEHKYRIIDQDTIINSYGQTSIRLP